MTGPVGPLSFVMSDGRICRTVTVYGSAVDVGGAAGAGCGMADEVTTAASGPDADASSAGPSGVAAKVNVVELGIPTTKYTWPATTPCGFSRPENVMAWPTVSWWGSPVVTVPPVMLRTGEEKTR